MTLTDNTITLEKVTGKKFTAQQLRRMTENPSAMNDLMTRVLILGNISMVGFRLQTNLIYHFIILLKNTI